VTIALIVIGVVVFLAIDAYVLYRVFGSRRSADDFGAMPVPGEIALTLPAGKLKLTYQESYKAPSTPSGGIRFATPETVEVTLTSPTGEELELKGPGFRGMGSSRSTGRDWSRDLIGTAEITQPGEYTLTARGDLADAVEPQILAGR
jgi:hypothetical protein